MSEPVSDNPEFRQLMHLVLQQVQAHQQDQQEQFARQVQAHQQDIHQVLQQVQEHIIQLQQHTDEFMPLLQEALTPDPWEPLSSCATNVSFLPILKPYWEGCLQWKGFCCILQGYYNYKQLERFPEDCDHWTVGAHIIPRACHVNTIQHILQWEQGDVDSEKNGLLLCKQFEDAFDHKKLCFIYDSVVNRWIVRVMDGKLHGIIKLTRDRKDKKKGGGERYDSPFQPPDLTWEKVNGTKVYIADCVSRAALVYHAHCTCQKHAKLSLVNYKADKEWQHVIPPLTV